jgi:hypothetical protein
VKESGDPHPGETPSEVLVTGILSEGQVNVDSRAGRAGAPETAEALRAVDRVVGHVAVDGVAGHVAVDKVVNSGGKITLTVPNNSSNGMEEEKDYKHVREEK